MSRNEPRPLLPVDAHLHGSSDRTRVLALRSLALAEAHQALADDPGPVCIGLHPWDVRAETLEADLRDLSSLLADPRAVAVGECGIDRRRGPPLDLQREAFRIQARLAERLAIPLVAHCVGAASDLLEIRARERFRAPWILHGWRGTPAHTAALVHSTDFVFSFGPDLPRAAPNMTESVTIAPIDRILIETDDSGASVEDVEREVAKRRGIAPDELRRSLHANWKRLFASR